VRSSTEPQPRKPARRQSKPEVGKRPFGFGLFDQPLEKPTESPEPVEEEPAPKAESASREAARETAHAWERIPQGLLQPAEEGLTGEELAEMISEAVEGPPPEEPSPPREEGEKRRGKRRRRGSGRKRRRESEQAAPSPAPGEPVEEPEAVSTEELPRRPKEPLPAAEEARDVDEVEDVEDVESSEDEQELKAGHRAIPTWEEAVGLIITSNLESRAKRPPESSRGRDRRNKGRGSNKGHSKDGPSGREGGSRKHNR
jgi:hypothetical protein